ncbi:hypothetical protein FOCC_FOCC001629 [Frankliniella occidentalis]|nr:hypothetical protein FOCC_FOCC001629 [Frankliniella occidentalis]
MAAQWMGFTISIDCGPMGIFQGVVTAVEAEPQSVTLSRVFHNGVPHTSPSIVISALDIKDLTIIAAPQAQLDPVVELKKPIPTRPGRGSWEGAQNFHSQPAPPRMLHLNDIDLDPRKAPLHLEYEPMIPQMGSLSSTQNEMSGSGQSLRHSPAQSSDRRQQLISSAAAAVQLSALQAALPGALRLSAPPAASSANCTPKLNTAQAVSQNAQQSSSQARGQSKEGPGVFKLTAALAGDGNRTPHRRDRLRQRWQARDEACFGSPTHNGFDQDFDFEKNLALFDKQAVFEEIAGQRPDIVQAANDPRRQQNYRHDQNILVNNRRIPTIIVPNPGSAEYVTDDGLVIPTMRPELLRQLHQKAHDVGFTFDRQSELFARCATEMSLQLLGGAHRLTPHNAHQWPTVIVMVGPHSQGAAGVMCARQLECQGVSSVVLVVNEAAAPPLMKRELNFYKCSGGPIVTSIEQLPETVDLVIMALAGHLPSDVANSLEYGKAASWASNKRAPVLALDPPPVGTPGIITRFALAPTLPVTYSPQNGKIYLCNLGIPIVVFKEMGIRYRSPFGSKFVIPLHPNDE